MKTNKIELKTSEMLFALLLATIGAFLFIDITEGVRPIPFLLAIAIAWMVVITLHSIIATKKGGKKKCKK